MVYEEDTFRLCHELSEAGKALYAKMLAEEADKMLVDNEHKALAILKKVLDFFKLDSDLV